VTAEKILKAAHTWEYTAEKASNSIWRLTDWQRWRSFCSDDRREWPMPANCPACHCIVVWGETYGSISSSRAVA